MVFVWVNKRDWRHPGPIVNVAIRNAHSLAASGAETHLCLGAGPASDTNSDLLEFYGLNPIPTLHIHRISRRALIRLGKKTSSGPIFRAAMRLVASLVRQHPAKRIAVLSREGSFLPHMCWLRWRFRDRLKTGYELHDFYADLGWRRKEGLKIKSQDLRQQWLERFFLPQVDGLICITAAQQSLYRKLFPKIPSLAVPLGTQPQNSGVAGFDRLLLRRVVYVGRLTRAKGSELLLRAAARFRDRQIRLAFWGGSPEQAAELTTRAFELGLSDIVETVSSRPPEDLRKALATEATLGLVPLEDSFYNRFLTCPVKALDYLSHGLPVVASDLESTREVLGPNGAGAFFPPGQEEALAKAVLELLDHPARYFEAANAASRRGLDLSWKNRAQKIREFVEGLGTQA
jgi:glycosyltransferase involved in cell wall biosynthesis